MSRNKTYTQCRLHRVDANNNLVAIMVSWIPSEIAIVGKTVRLKRWPRDVWSEGWRVISAGEPVDGDAVEAGEVDYKHQREMSDA